MLRLNAAKINPLELEESKLFSAEEKQRLAKAASEIDLERIQTLTKKAVDYSNNRRQLPQLFASQKTASCQIESLHEEICLSFERDGQTCFVPVKLRNIETYFQLVEKAELGKVLAQNKQIEIVFTSCKFNIFKK